MADYHADVAELFTRQGAAHPAALAIRAADRFEVEAVRAQWALFERQLDEAGQAYQARTAGQRPIVAPDLRSGS